MNDAERRAELAHFLRTRRERLSPVQVDLPRLGRRSRTPGLRREELAQIADVSLSWYIKIEQQRDLLMQTSSEFRAWWSLHDVNQAHMGRKELNHLVVGSLVLQTTTFQVADAPHLKLFHYTSIPEEDTAS